MSSTGLTRCCQSPLAVASNYNARIGFLSMQLNGVASDPSVGMGSGTLQQLSNTKSTLGSEAASVFRVTAQASDAGSTRTWCFTVMGLSAHFLKIGRPCIARTVDHHLSYAGVRLGNSRRVCIFFMCVVVPSLTRNPM